MPLSPASLNGYSFASNAEKEIYTSAHESGYFSCTERYLYHSLNMVNTGDKKLKREIDFVYMDADCILFFEVKGGQVKFDALNNKWYTLGGTKEGDPFKQAYDALFHTRDKLLPDLFGGSSVARRMVFGIGVLFPEILKPDEFRKNTIGQMEYDPEIIYDYQEHKKGHLITYIQKIKSYWSRHPQYTERSGISHKEISIISKYFRQDLHCKLPVSDLLKKSCAETQRLTGMQMYVLDNLKYNPGKGCFIMGGPGTGKTLLALELLKRSTEAGVRTLFVCYNKNLAEFLKQQTKKFLTAGSFEVFHLHSLYRNSAYYHTTPAPVDESIEYWSRDLPLQFIRNVKDAMKSYFDYLIIDEGQDIMNEYHMEALGSLLKGGLESGNWAIFMDKEFQNIYNPDAEEYFTYMRDVYPSFITTLQLNCRNTISTIQRASLQTGFPEMPCLRTDQIWKSEIKTYKSDSDLINKINDCVIRMEQDGIERKNITILCWTREQITGIVISNPDKYIESAFSLPGKINLSTIHSYKGLENEFIIICGPKDYDPSEKKQMSLIYIANTRATSQSIFYIDIKYHSLIVDRIMNFN